MFKIESYVTPILLSYVDKYVRDFKPADAQVSLWGGGVVLHNLVLKADVLQREVALPFTLVSGRIHELLIQVPWTKIMSEPIIVTIDTIECVLSLNPPDSPEDSPPPDTSRKTQVVEAPPGYMQALVRRIVSNIALRVHHLIVKYVQDDIVLSLNVKHLAVNSTGANWEPAFADIDQTQPVLRRLVRLDDLTLCLDKADSDGKIRFYQEPLLYRCQLDLRVLTRLVSANTRRASSLSVQLRSSKLAWSVTNDQLVLLMRLLRERSSVAAKLAQPVPKQPVVSPPSHQNSANSAEPARSDSWSEWAWSWLPTWADREGDAEEALMPASPTPLFFTAYLDDISLVFKVMETESGTRKRARGVLELVAMHAAAKTSMWSPTMLRVRVGARQVAVRSHGKCVCGHLDYNAALDEPTVFLKGVESESMEEEWKWPEEDFSDKIDPAEAVDEQYRATPENTHVIEGEMIAEPFPDEYPIETQLEFQEENDAMFAKMAPLLYLEYTHDRSPPQAHTNPYENPPTDFQYSDWVEECMLKVKLEPIELRVSMGLLHRCAVLKAIFQDLPPVPEPELPMRVLTVEECDALNENLPQRRIKFEARGVRVRVMPWDHSLQERPSPPPLYLDIDMPKSCIVVSGPLYPHRVCSAACQIPEDNGPLWQAARLHLTAALTGVQAKICSPTHNQHRPCARAELRLVTHILLNKAYFNNIQRVEYSYSMKIKELNICGSAPRLTAAWHVPMSIVNEQVSLALKYTSLVKDALNDEEAVAVDATLENLCVRGYLTRSVNTHILSLQSAKATAFHETKGTLLKQAWLFSGPDSPVPAPYVWIALQWCSDAYVNAFDYLGVWTEPTAISVDPLFIAWLAYKPTVKPYESSTNMFSASSARSMSSSQYLLRRRPTPPSSSGRGASRSGSGAELVHVRPRSGGSSSEPSDKKDVKPSKAQSKLTDEWWVGEWVVPLHGRLRSILLNVELGLVLVYVTMSSVPAVDCATIRDAMERHAATTQRVLTVSLGRLSLNSNTSTKRVWQEIKPDGPTFLTQKFEQIKIATESFPWKMRLADVSCYTLEVQANTDKPYKEKVAGGLRSTLKTQQLVMPRTVLELVTTTVTLSVVTKTLQVKSASGPKKEQKKQAEVSAGEQRMKYFNTGMAFRPTTLKEFVRGPARRKKASESDIKQAPTPSSTPTADRGVTDGPVVSLGFHVHADTPPIIVRMDHDQVNVVTAAVHCVNHIRTLLKRTPLVIPKHGNTAAGSHRSLIRSVSEIEEIQSQSEDNISDNRSDLIPIFEARPAHDSGLKLKTFFWLQWVVSRATLVVATEQVKLVINIDDIITTIDLQTHYNQLKIKLTSASVRHYERSGSEEWTAGVLGGRVLEVREPANAKDESQFLAVTITQARISNLPATWKEELHPKLLEQKSGVDSMWEIYATVAPLEAVVQPNVLENIMTLMHELKPRSFCPLHTEITHSPPTWHWPFCYVTAGGLRLLVACKEQSKDEDDTLVFVIGKISVNPHPENPICRHAVAAGADAGWMNGNSGVEGRQYEVIVKNVSLRSAQFRQLIYHETSEDMMKGTGGENPALKWSQPNVLPLITTILHAVDISCVLAPAQYSGGVLASGPAVEINLVSDCYVEVSVRQVALLQQLAAELHNALTDSDDVGLLIDEEIHGVCPYAPFILGQEAESPAMFSETVLNDIPNDLNRSLAADSGVDTSFPFKAKADEGVKKSMSVAFAEQMNEASEYLEVFVTMGTIELSLYVSDDDSPSMAELRPPGGRAPAPPPAAPHPSTAKEEYKVRRETKDEGRRGEDRDSQGTRSVTETTRAQDAAKLHILTPPQAAKSKDSLPLMHMTLMQPNLYYWKKKTQKSLQVSLFNAWLGLGMSPAMGQWHSVLLSTARGVPDPISDIPPALATMKLVAPVSGWQSHSSTNVSCTRGTIRLDIERPVLLEVSTDRLRRLSGILALLEGQKEAKTADKSEPVSHDSLLHKLRRALLSNGMEHITVQTCQMGVCGSEGTVAWDGASLQLAAGSRPERLNARALLAALLVSAGPPADRRHLLLQPLTLGVEMEASWEAWRRAEGGVSSREPTVRVAVELDRVTFDLRPHDLAAVHRMHEVVTDLLSKKERPVQARTYSSDTLYHMRSGHAVPFVNTERRFSLGSVESADSTGDHYYKDDLRSGAFKILSGGQLPMAYQVMLHNNAVSWRYPHPRAITRVVAFPLPGQNEEIECVLELYMPMLARWEPHTYFKIPVGEPRELVMHVRPPDAAFAVMWRFRVCFDKEPPPPAYEFNIDKFAPRQDPLLMEPQPEPPEPAWQGGCGVSAEQLSGVLRVDSYFAPRLLPRVRLLVRLTELELFLHNSLPSLSSQATALEGYYVSRPLMRSHRVLSVMARDVAAHAQLGSPAGVMLLLDTALSCDLLDCATGTMEQLVSEFRAQAGVSLSPYFEPRTRLAAGHVRVALHVPRLRTLHALADDWWTALQQYVLESPSSSSQWEPAEANSKGSVSAGAAQALEGRVSLWVHNSCAGALRLGQQATDEVVPLGPGARLAYRWRSPTAPKKLRLAIAGPSTTWHWSTSVPFTPGCTKVRLEEPEMAMGCKPDLPGAGVYLHVKVQEEGARRHMILSGRLVLANMLRLGLLYKVRAQAHDSNKWVTVSSGELTSETVGRSVTCSADCEMVLKIKFMQHDTGWSGDIPLKECPKENVPWLVKVPSDGEMAYTSVWCRVTRARSDGRILAAVWPLYVLRSHLPLDTDVLIVTESNGSAADMNPAGSAAALGQAQQSAQQPVPQPAQPPPLVQTTAGRGTCTHLIAPGTTAARHTLSFQYRNIECPVTREAVPLHYGVTDTSVFDKRAPVNCLSEVVDTILDWLEHSGRNSDVAWPYSVVTKHWPTVWKPALLQPRCDINVRYEAVRAGGGCSLEVRLCPLVLLCNAAAMPLTLRAHDAAPLCKLEPGTAISPPSTILKKPFFISVEQGRETFVSSELQVSGGEPGRYGAPPPGHVALEHAADFAIQCNQKVALLTLYYEIKHDINVLGISSTYVLINRLDSDLLVSAIAVPADVAHDDVLRSKTYKSVEPTDEGSIHGTPLTRFWLNHRWRGGSPTELRTYLCIAFPAGNYPARAPVPIELGTGSVRRSIGLIGADDKSVAVVVSQVRHDSRWLVVVAPDPCPQFVVHNRTRAPVMLAQPTRPSDEPSTSVVTVSPECHGVRWWCMAEPSSYSHYSSPAYCARYPPPANATLEHCVPFLTFAKYIDEEEPGWCAPVAVTDGEQLLQLFGGVTIKLRVRTYPHSTLLELQDVDQNDISASDIRRRLLGAFTSQDTVIMRHEKDLLVGLERIPADSKLLEGNSTPVPSLTSFVLPADADDPAQHADIGNSDDLFIDVDDRIKKKPDGSYMVFFSEKHKTDEDCNSKREDTRSVAYSEASYMLQEVAEPDFAESGEPWHESERARCVVAGVEVEMAVSSDAVPLLALHLDRTALLVLGDNKKTKAILSVSDIQIDNVQYESGQYDFGVVASTRAVALAADRWPPLWNMFAEREAFATRHADARLLVKAQHDTWTVANCSHRELTELEIRVGPLALYVEDAYVTALVQLSRLALPAGSAGGAGGAGDAGAAAALAEARALRAPLRLRLLHVHPLDLTLTLHTAVRMYIALDQSPLLLSAFKLTDMMTSAERLTHALTVHYLSAAILGAGWVVGGLELLGAPGALAARVGGATGGVRGVASAAAAALLRSLSAWASSLARNLDLLAGDEEHARRAAAARRRPPPSFVAGLMAGITNFAINILGAVGGLAHHPLVGVAVGETESGAAALRRGLLGALTKPLSATADLVAYAGHGLLRQAGWDPVPQPRRPSMSVQSRERAAAGWRRDCVRWSFRLADLTALAGFEATLDGAPLQLLVSHKCLVVADLESERIVEMIDLRFCTVGPFRGNVIELFVTQRKSKMTETRTDDDDEYQISAVAMARVARYTGAEGGPAGETRVLALQPSAPRALALHAALATAARHNSDSHFAVL